MDQGRQGRDQVDAVVMPDVRRERRPASASYAGLQSRQFLADARNTGADQGLVADEPEGEADQDRREGRAPRTLCRLPDGGSRHHGKCSRKYCGSSLNYGHSHHQRQRETFDGHAFKSTTGGVRPNARENGQISPRPPFGLPDAPVAVRTSRLSCGKAGKARIFTPVWDSSGESRIRVRNAYGDARLDAECWSREPENS